MGRLKSKNRDLPARMFAREGVKGTTYYYLADKPEGGRKWVNLGRDKVAAIKLYADLDNVQPEAKPENLFSEVVARYKREVYLSKKPATQRDNDREFAKLLAVFGALPIDNIKPVHVRKYMDMRGKKAKIRANREKALLSHLFNMARSWGLTESPNPCDGIKGFKETGRDKYVFDDEFRAVYEAAEQPLRDAMDLYLLMGQRVSDALKLKRTDIRDGRIWTRQGKTGKLVGMLIAGELEVVIKRILARAPAGKVIPLHLLLDAKGEGMTYAKLRRMFDQAREKSGVTFQLRDLRAKSATDEDSLLVANERLAHSNMTMTKHYRRATKVGPLR
ncbi:Site-specific recombinase XerD [Andreprevotia lacus DSM 23236]|jgi:integrase|uniref:Site-specific recombinase XerD n=1 Tax=Andreprevotia lacus DSM 23236 TaxID=1121001 RepID=A0A1W1XJW9_9NEIS|nr:tyrosine-type recombinase/integrase [Andreprevotia lacus]SMC24279.1 Site-specific recombinase XerD [Andreprevotia lacus DSM 23236]